MKRLFHRARPILTENRVKMDQIAEVLLEKETLTREEFLALLNGEATPDQIRNNQLPPEQTTPPPSITTKVEPEPPPIPVRLRPEPA